MKICRDRFNINLALVFLVGWVSGCASDKHHDSHVVSTFRLYQEVKSDPLGSTEEASVFREHPIKLTVNKEPFLTEKMVKGAKVVDDLGGFALSIQLDQEGSWLLEQYSAANKGRHLLVFSQFVNPGEKNINAGRWLAAPRIQNHITDGRLTFTPDASRAEAEQIALGLNNVAKDLGTGEETKW